MSTSETTAADGLIFAVDETGVARITLNRPQARNALTFAMYRGLIALCERIEGDRAVKSVILAGAGDKAFAAGTDIGEFRRLETAQDALGYERFMDRVLTGLERLRVPTIAAIAGACTGGGAAIAAACDLRLGTRDLRFGFPIARTLGNGLSMANLRRLSGLIGAPRVKDILFTARLVGGDEALAIGLVTELVEDAAALNARADALARLLAGHAPLTLQATKEGLRRLAAEDAGSGEAGAEEAGSCDVGRPGDDLILMTYMSRDFREGMEAFLAKRPPRWEGR